MDECGSQTHRGAVNQIASRAWIRTVRFIGRQERNFKIVLTRRALHAFLSNLTNQYRSIYIVALGADPIQLGSLQSVGNGISSLISLPVGWLIDRYDLKKVFLLGIAMLAGAGLFYASASHWVMLFPAVILFALGLRLTCQSCTVTCAHSLPNPDRATGRGLCTSISSAAAMFSPLLGAFLITLFGGLNARGIRPLYAIQFAGFSLIFAFIATKLTDLRAARPKREELNFIRDLREVFSHGQGLKRWILINALVTIPFSMVSPYMPLFAHEQRGADEYILGGMTTAATLITILMSVPLGRMADRIGRKSVLYLLTPLYYAANLALVFGRGSIILLAVGALWGFYQISWIVTSAMSAELVSMDQMGRWTGVLGLFRGLVSVPGPIIGGMIWNHIGPAYVFLIPIAIDLVMRLPLLATMQETLGSQEDTDICLPPPG